jgi:hypothetical protein
MILTVSSSDPLSFTLPSNPFIDFLRVVAVLLGGFLFLISMVRWLQHERYWSAIMGMSLGLLAAAQELQQIGHDFIPWRLPVLLLGCGAGVRYMYFGLDEIRKGPTR